MKAQEVGGMENTEKDVGDTADTVKNPNVHVNESHKEKSKMRIQKWCLKSQQQEAFPSLIRGIKTQTQEVHCAQNMLNKRNPT